MSTSGILEVILHQLFSCTCTMSCSSSACSSDEDAHEIVVGHSTLYVILVCMFTTDSYTLFSLPIIHIIVQWGRTAIMRAAEEGHTPTVKVMVEEGGQDRINIQDEVT